MFARGELQGHSENFACRNFEEARECVVRDEMMNPVDFTLKFSESKYL